MEQHPIVESPHHVNPLLEGACIALTAARLGQAVDLTHRIKSDKPIGLALAGVVATDILDGVVARRLGADTSDRRIADAVVDRVTIGTACAAIWERTPAARPYIGLIVARDVVVGGGQYS